MSVKTVGGRHTVEFELRHVRVHRRLPKGTTRAEAQALEAKLRHEIFATRDLGAEPTIPLEAALGLWLEEQVAGSKSEISRRAHARALHDFVVGRTLQDLPDVADEYREHGKAAGLASATIDRRLAILKAVAKWAWRKRWTHENLSARIQLANEDNARHVYLSAAQVRKLAAKAETREGRAWITLACSTGLRRSELHGVGKLRGGTVRRGVVYLGTKTKSGKPRAVPIAKPGLPYVKFFPFDRTVDSLDWEWRKARKAAGYGPGLLRYHDLRHTYASLLINEGVDLFTIHVLMGHESMQTTKRYAHLQLKTLKRAVGRIPR